MNNLINMNLNGYVYFVIPPELKDTNRVKIGMSNLDNDNRLKSYGKNANIVIKYNCCNAKWIENKIIKAFKDNFKLIKGNEYFEGDIEEMKKIFIRELFVNENKSSIEEHDGGDVEKIVTYEKWNKHNIDIKIIKKITGEGFYRFGKNHLWRTLYDRANFKNKDCETLISLVTHFDEGYNDNESIYNDIINKCYISKKHIKYYKLDYNKFILQNNDDIFIFNSLNLKCKPLDEEIGSAVLVERYKNIFNLNKHILNNFININNKIVDEILNNLVKEKIKFNYKKFMYRLLTYSNDENIFYDDNKWCLFTDWTNSLFTSLGIGSDIIYSSEYYYNKKEFLKNYKKYKPRLLIIKPCRKFNGINIDTFRKFNFINIIICDPNNNIYNTKTFMNYLNINASKIMDVINYQNARTVELNYHILYEDLIFRQTSSLQINLLKWILN